MSFTLLYLLGLLLGLVIKWHNIHNNSEYLTENKGNKP